MKAIGIRYWVNACKRMKQVGLDKRQRKEFLKELKHWEVMVAIRNCIN